MKTPVSSHVAVSTVLLLGLAACGGRAASDAGETVSPLADNSTLKSFLAYQKEQAPIAPIDPATLQRQLDPVSDTAEPTPLL